MTTLLPILFNRCTSPIAAIPLVTLKKITGTINILIIFINRSPTGFTQIEKSWKNSPAIIPMIKQTPTLCGKYFLFNKNVLILSPRFPNNLLY